MLTKTILLILLAVISFGVSTQLKKERVPSYFGIQVRPLFPTRFIGNSTLSMEQEDPELIYITTTLRQKVGYSFGGTVRVGLSKLIALETGLNFTQRNFDLNMSVPDSSIEITRDLSFISYDLPINALFYIPLAEKWYMNASLGIDVNFSPTEIEVKTDTTGANFFWHRGVLDSKLWLGKKSLLSQSSHLLQITVIKDTRVILKEPLMVHFSHLTSNTSFQT